MLCRLSPMLREKEKGIRIGFALTDVLGYSPPRHAIVLVTQKGGSSCPMLFPNSQTYRSGSARIANAPPGR